LEQYYYSFSPTIASSSSFSPAIASSSSSSPGRALPIKLEHGQGHKATLGRCEPNLLSHVGKD